MFERSDVGKQFVEWLSTNDTSARPERRYGHLVMMNEYLSRKKIPNLDLLIAPNPESIKKAISALSSDGFFRKKYKDDFPIFLKTLKLLSQFCVDYYDKRDQVSLVESLLCESSEDDEGKDIKDSIFAPCCGTSTEVSASEDFEKSIPSSPSMIVPLEKDFHEYLENELGLAKKSCDSYSSAIRAIERFALEHGYGITSIYGEELSLVESFLEKLYLDELFITDNERAHNRYKTSLSKLFEFTRMKASGKDNHLETTSKKKSHSDSLSVKLYAISKVYDDPQGVLIDRIVQMLGPGYSAEEVMNCLDKMDGVTKIDKETYSFSTRHAVHPKKIELNDFDQEKFHKVLLDRFCDGLQFDSIDLDNFRETYDCYYDEIINFPDDELIKRLKLCGLFFEGRLFAPDGIIDDSSKEKLFSYIEKRLCSDNKVLYYNSIYSDLSDVFELCFSMTGIPMLKAYIEYTAEPGKYYFFENYMSTEKNVRIDHSEEISSFMLAAGKPVPYKDVYTGLPHIPEKIIKAEIHNNPCYQRNEKECYFHIGIFEFSSEEEEKISELINQEIDDNGYAIWARVFSEIQVQMPVFIENNVYLFSLGFRNALAKCMNEKFDFNGEVVSRLGEKLKMTDVFRLYAKHHAPFSDKDIYYFSKEIDSTIYFWALAEESTRVSSELFMPKDQVIFDVAATDKAIETYFSSGYMFIKDVDSFLIFPNVGYEWNEYLLESYLLNYSKKFALLNNGLALNNVAGAIVKRDDKYTEFVDVCADAIAESGVELKEASALNFLAEVKLITRRSYKDIDVALTKARQIRNRKGL